MNLLRISSRGTILLLVVCVRVGLAADAPQSKVAVAKEVLSTRCQKCHFGAGSVAGRFDAARMKTLKTQDNSSSRPYVTPGKSKDSWIIERVRQSEMPPKDGGGPLPEAEIKALEDWIDSGAPDGIDESRPFFGPKEVFSEILKDIEKQPHNVRGSLRYFSLASKYNNRTYSERDLCLARAALAKVLNSLSWYKELVFPRMVGPQQAILAIDLRELGWSDFQWQLLLKQYPYGEQFDEPVIREVEKEVSRNTDCTLPVIRLDWFVVSATQPPLYESLLELPSNAHELERNLLRVNARYNFDTNNLLRGGVKLSKVSYAPRILERHPSQFGAYWKSFDFFRFPKGKEIDPLAHPLGPKKSSEFKELEFAHDGGEYIFQLPNGMHGYYLSDRAGKLIPSGDTDLVRDRNETAGQSTSIVNGLSCIACHKNGINEFSDVVRTSSENVFNEDQLKKVQALYPGNNKMSEFIAQDNKVFQESLAKIMARYLPPTSGFIYKTSALDILACAEPVSDVARAYFKDPLDLEAICAELSLDPKDGLSRLGDENQRSLGLAGLSSNPPSSILRYEWTQESRDLQRLTKMQTVAEKLRRVAYQSK